jgi:acetylornithine deacetylase
MLEAHLDTVSADNMEIEPFSPRIAAGKLYGRGACDTKGSLAAFLHATRSLVDQKQKPKYNIVIVGTADEEYRFTGAQRAIAQGLKADFGIAGEPTSMHIVHAHKGVTRWKIVTHGVAAHSAYPERGENAIYTMGHILTRLEEYSLQLVEQQAHPLLGTPSLSIGVIQGGQAVNVVPDRCWIELDRRTLPGETLEAVLQPVRQLLREVPRWDFEEPHVSVGGMEVRPGAACIATLSRAIANVVGETTVEAAQYATNAGVYNSIGIPTVVFGPGNIAQAHTSSEYIELEQLLQATEIITRLLTQ